jgi:hypothetical protein
MKHYFDALDRLISGKTKFAPKGAPINNDSVSIEAGFKKGSIKKSRPQFSELIEAIRIAQTSKERNPEAIATEKFNKAKEAKNEYIKLYEEALSRELSLVKEIYDLKVRLAQLTGEKILPLRKKNVSNKK